MFCPYEQRLFSVFEKEFFNSLLKFNPESYDLLFVSQVSEKIHSDDALSSEKVMVEELRQA
jgi:hypothetical protein